MGNKPVAVRILKDLASACAAQGDKAKHNIYLRRAASLEARLRSHPQGKASGR